MDAYHESHKWDECHELLIFLFVPFVLFVSFVILFRVYLWLLLPKFTEMVGTQTHSHLIVHRQIGTKIESWATREFNIVEVDGILKLINSHHCLNHNITGMKYQTLFGISKHEALVRKPAF